MKSIGPVLVALGVAWATTAAASPQGRVARAELSYAAPGNGPAPAPSETAGRLAAIITFHSGEERRVKTGSWRQSPDTDIIAPGSVPRPRPWRTG